MNPIDRELLKANGKVLISAEGKQRLRALARYALLRTGDPHSGVDLHDLTELMRRAAEVGAECGVPAPAGGGRAGCDECAHHQRRASDNLDIMERETVLRVFEESGRKWAEAAARLGIGRTTLFRKLQAYKVTADEMAAGEAENVST